MPRRCNRPFSYSYAILSRFTVTSRTKRFIKLALNQRRAAHNYDGDMLTDEIAQVHRSPGFITSNLIGKKEDGTIIKGITNLLYCIA